MSGTSPTPAEQHLGDRLAALVDGELDHDARERVQAHLATCAKCKAEANAQRRLKSVFAQTAPPAPSAGLLARLQGLPGGPLGPSGPSGPLGGQDGDDPGGLFDPGGFGDGVFPMTAGSFGADSFGYSPVAAHGGMLPGDADSGFRIHEVSRPDSERTSWRARRIAFAAAGAVSLAAMALGGSVPLGTAAEVLPRDAGNNVTPMRVPGDSVPASVAWESTVRQGSGASVAHHDAATSPPTVLSTQATSPRLFPTGMLNGGPLSPLIDPSSSAIRIDQIADVSGPSATPGPSGLAAPMLPQLPLSVRR